MGTGLVVLALIASASILVGALVATLRLPILVVAAIGLAVLNAAHAFWLPTFPLESEHFAGAALRLSMMGLPVIMLTIWVAMRLTRKRIEN